MKLSVFNEFAASAELSAQIEAVVPIDRAPEPNALAKSEEDLAIISRNAKLLFDAATPAADVDAVLAKLTPLGFEVVKRNPVTSAGAPMLDRVILKLTA